METYQLLLILYLATSKSFVASALNKTLVIGYAVPYTKGWPMGINMAPSIIQGIREVRNRHLLDEYDIQWQWWDTWCQPLQAIRGTVDIESKTKLHVIIGEVCSTACQPMALLASAWSIPFVSIGCMSPKLSDRKTYPTFSRVIGTSYATGPAYNGIADMMSWDRAGIIYDNSDVYTGMAISTSESMENSGKTVFMRSIANTMNGNEIIQEKYDILRKVIEDFKKVTRAIYLFLYSADRRNSLIIAYDLGMLNGEYAFITSSVGPEIKESFPFRPEVGTWIYEGVLVRDSMEPTGPDWDNFARQVIEDFNNPAFEGWPISPPNSSLDVINVYAGMVHDAVLAWSYGVNKTLAQGKSPEDGFKVTENIYNFSFSGITGPLSMDYRGERKPSYKVEIIQKGEMVRIMEWHAVGNTMIKVYKPEDRNNWSGLTWPGNKAEPPTGIPLCGWSNEYCKEKDTNNRKLAIWVSVLVVVVAVVATVGVWMIISREKYEMGLKVATSCCVSWNDIHQLDRSSVVNSMSLRSSVTDVSIRQHFVEAGRLNGDIIAIKHLGPNPVNIADRQVRIELSIMKQLRHENVNSFMGICLEPNHACILMAYSSRGSLQDIIGDERVNLIWDLKVSLATDIAQGMKYIHNSAIGHHGHLSSSNCVVDSRWVCKITDHGLQTIKNLSGRTPEGDRSQHLLWTAPELLRDDGFSVKNKKAADVYSYGIILQEIIIEDEPFGACKTNMDVNKIIEKLKAGKPVFRPFIPPGLCNEEWLYFVVTCWDENPSNRPLFTSIIARLHHLNNGKAQSLVDDMIQRLEAHTSHLENMVAKRCEELHEEKNKMEVLLKELLPGSVADSLKLGKQVKPETFDNVTIFFSDIVSFTKIASKGTPMDVVKMLNMMYTVFDETSAEFDVYKLATIGDAYFVASGVPIRNGNKHAGEICNMAVKLLEAVSNCQVPHIPGEVLKLRIGVHSGPCVAGITGLKMPKYLLFGDTVDIASKMESEGESMKIHVSKTTADILHKIGGFSLQYRGKLMIKGAGEIDTFWLVPNAKMYT